MDLTPALCRTQVRSVARVGEWDKRIIGTQPIPVANRNTLVRRRVCVSLGCIHDTGPRPFFLPRNERMNVNPLSVIIRRLFGSYKEVMVDTTLGRTWSHKIPPKSLGSLRRPSDSAMSSSLSLRTTAYAPRFRLGHIDRLIAGYLARQRRPKFKYKI